MRQFAAWLGLVPGQYSSGGNGLGRITKAGDASLRSLLVLGAKVLLAAAKKEADAISRWAVALAERRGYLAGRGGHRGQERTHGLGCCGAGKRLRYRPDRRPPHPTPDSDQGTVPPPCDGKR